MSKTTDVIGAACGLAGVAVAGTSLAMTLRQQRQQPIFPTPRRRGEFSSSSSVLPPAILAKAGKNCSGLTPEQRQDLGEVLFYELDEAAAQKALLALAVSSNAAERLRYHEITASRLLTAVEPTQKLLRQGWTNEGVVPRELVWAVFARDEEEEEAAPGRLAQAFAARKDRVVGHVADWIAGAGAEEPVAEPVKIEAAVLAAFEKIEAAKAAAAEKAEAARAAAAEKAEAARAAAAEKAKAEQEAATAKQTVNDLLQVVRRLEDGMANINRTLASGGGPRQVTAAARPAGASAGNG